ncbi:hypothetical protein [Alkalimonas amylolytica]|uniref:Uncharacterized protein n=1 Tax=Alkalimonas amylolytica TaxID=152573 RepID=A0A1H3XI63_ALKAM|nr:hypothetical protein [Alkalimonas amylolytica]SDZ98940.1 hypothetical protein SAMN04488051_101253 [Alkalimonas amylolytica]
MNTKMMLTAAVVFCATAFAPVQANEVSVSQIMADLLQKQAAELQEQLRNSVKENLQQMMEQLVPKVTETAELSTEQSKEEAAE